MRIDLIEHRDLIRGAAEVEETPEGVRSSRFTAEALEYYRDAEGAGNQARFTAGVRIAMGTDSNVISMRLLPGMPGQMRDYQIDVLVDEQECHTFGPEDPNDELEFTLDLPRDGEHEIEILLPTSAEVIVAELELADGALFRPSYCSDERMLFLGDSVTMGTAASSPLRSYAALLAAQLETDYLNWAVGRVPLCGELGKLALDQEWQRVIIGCGSADYARNRNADECAEQLAVLLDHLTGRPGVIAYVVTPLVWRGKENVRNEAGCTLDDYRRAIRRVAAAFPDEVVIVEGMQLVPDDEDNFAADGRHPSDEGMAIIAENLLMIMTRE